MAYGFAARSKYRRPAWGARSYRRSYARSRAPAPKRRRATAKRRAPSRRAKTSNCDCGTHELSPGEKFLLAQIDPFETKALGAKIPDSSTQPSVAIPCQELNYGIALTLVTDVSCSAYLPAVTQSIIQATSGAGSWTWPAGFGGNNWTKRTDVIAAVEAARPVAHGIRISSPVAPTTATGFVHLALAVETINGGVTTWQYPTTIAGLSGYSWYRRVTLASLTQTPITIINKYVDETAFRYLGQDVVPAASGANANTFHIPLSWGALLVAVEGVPALQPINVEMMLHLEAIPKSIGILSGSNAAPVSPAILAGAANVSANTDFAHTENEQDTYVNQALSNAAAGAAEAGNAFVMNAVLPAARGAGYSIANAAMGAAIAGVGGILGVNANPARLALG